MKKYIILLAAAAFVAIACSKEQPIDDTTTDDQTVETPANAGKVTLTATMPDFIDDASKASINGSTGAFGWEDDDRISVKYYLSTDHSVTQNFTFHCTNPSTGLFESESAITEGYVIASDAAVVAEYPVRNPEYDYYYDYRTFADDPGKTFIMEATVDAEGKLAFVHKSALVKLTIKNVPSFTYYIYVGTGNDTAKYTRLDMISFSSDQESLTYYLPVRPTSSNENLHIQVRDLNYNMILEKSTSNAVQINAGHYYVLPELTINNYILLTGSTNAAHKLGIQGRTYAGGWNSDWTEVDLTECSAGKYYIMANNYNSAEALQLELRANGSTQSATQFVINDNRTFDVSSNSMRGRYRVYARFSDAKKAEMVQSNRIKIRMWYGSQYDKPFVNASSEVSNNIAYHELPVDYYGHDNVWFKFHKPTDEGVYVQSASAVTINQDYWTEIN